MSNSSPSLTCKNIGISTEALDASGVPSDVLDGANFLLGHCSFLQNILEDFALESPMAIMGFVVMGKQFFECRAEALAHAINANVADRYWPFSLMCKRTRSLHDTFIILMKWGGDLLAISICNNLSD